MPNLVGTGLNQVPTNSMLGGLAYQDPDHASIKDLDLKNLSQINSGITDTAVDVFVYDTRKDSDGGAWRKRTQNTSWYNETLNTSTRGSRKEFPAVAVIVAEATRVTIYDGDDPDLPMWMKIEPNGIIDWPTSNTTRINISALNGILTTVTNDGGHLFKFVEDFVEIMYSSANYHLNSGRTIVDRNNSTSYQTVSGTAFRVYKMATYAMNDVAMTVLPNASVDNATGLPVPTIAVATNNGVSVIKDDGTVVDFSDNLSASRAFKTVMINGEDIIAYNHPNGTVQRFFNALTSSADNDVEMKYNYTYGGGGGSTENISATLRDTAGSDILVEKGATVKDFYAANVDGLSMYNDGEDRTFTPTTFSITDSRVAYATTSYNTGWMHGDIKGAFLSDIDIEDGVELVTNGTFDTNTTGWTMNGGGSTAIVSGQVQITNNGTTNCSLDQSITTVVGKTYEVSATITPQGGGPMPRLYVGSEFVQVGSNANSAQTVTLTYVATSTSTLISVNANTNVNNAVTLADNVTMKLTNNLIANPNLASSATQSATARLSSETYDNGDTSWSMVDASGTDNGYVAILFGGLTAGKHYHLSMDVDGNNALDSGYEHKIERTGKGITYLYHWDGTGAATLSTTFEAVSGQNVLYFYVNAITCNVSNFNIREIEVKDRSVNNKGLAAIGAIPKTPVATGADLVAYGPFATSSPYKHLVQPYNSDLLLGSSDFCITGWVNNTSNSNSVYEDIITFGNLGKVGYASMEPGSWFIQMNKAHGFNMYYRTNAGPSDSGWTNHSSHFQTYTLNGLGIWYKITLVRRGSEIYTYVNDDYIGSKSMVGSFTTTSNLNDMKLHIGYEGGTTYGPYIARFTRMALWKISKSAPSHEQVKKMYNDEKHLFQENAKATLYGSSDSVTALGYDDSNNVLHVGTSSGRSEFQGLRRINNTTDAVTTAISASNGFVAEQ